MSEIIQVAPSVSCHAWNKDHTQVAFSPNNTEIHIWKKTGSEWAKEHILAEHDQLVTGIDWAPNSNRIVSCSQDRNAYVWRFEEGKWKPTLVILRIQRAATYVKWSPDEKKFAVASGGKCVCVCYFDEENDWWLSKHIKKHDSTVLGVEWHPGSVLIATASSDFNMRVFSAFIKGVDARPGDTPFGSRLPLGECLGEYPGFGWVHNVVWSASGNQLAYCSHDSTITFIDVSGGAPGNVQLLRLNNLPFTRVFFTSETSLVAGGHDCSPILFSNLDGNWGPVRNLDEKKVEDKKPAGSQSAFKMFQNKVATGQASGTTKLETKHQNYINCIQGYQGTPGAWKKISTSALDGRIVIWDI